MKDVQNTKITKSTIIFTALILCGFCSTATYKFITAGERIGVGFNSFIDFVALYHHRNAKNINKFKEYDWYGHTIYANVSKEDNRTFDLLPAIEIDGLPYTVYKGNKIQDIRTIEPRGETLQDGFRTKPEYAKIINDNVEKYKSDYYKYRQ